MNYALDRNVDPTDEAALPDSPAAERKSALVITGLFFGLLLGGAALVPLDSGAVAAGTVTVSGNRQAVQHREGGIVSRLAVSEGQSVRKGQVLLVIASGELAANERGMTAEYYGLLAQRERLRAERDGLNAIPVPPEFSTLTPAERPAAELALSEQRRIFSARGGSIGAQQGVLMQRRRQNQEQVLGIDQQVTSNREQRRLLEDELAGMRALEKRGFASTNRIRQLERAAASLDGDFGEFKARQAQVREQTGEVSMQAVTLERNRIEEASTELRSVNLRLDEVVPKLREAREQLARAEVRAPANGRVVGLKAYTVGGVVGAGELLMEIVPQDRALVIDARVSPQDADDIAPGQHAQVQFPALQERNMPRLDGTIAKLSADSFADERTGERYFRAEIRIPESELQKIRQMPGRSAAIQSGLVADVVIPLRKRSALEYLLEPITRSIWLAGRQD